MGLNILKPIKRRIPGMIAEYPSTTKIYRERGGTPILEEAGAIRMRYDELPDMHKLETGEETKAVDLEAIIQSFQTKDPEDAVHLIEGVPVNGSRKTLVLRGVYDEGEIQRTDTFNGKPTVHFYEAESGQLVNWVPKFVDNDELDGDIHEEVRKGNTDRYDIPDKVNKEEDVEKVGIRPYLIDNKDERLTAWMDHLKRKFEKYEGGEGFWEEHFEVAMVLAVGLSITMIYYAVMGNVGDLIPYAETIANHAPSIDANLETIAETASGSSGGEGAPGR